MRLRWNGQGTILGIISEGGEDPIHIPEHCQGKFTVRSFSMKTKKKLLGDFLEACEAAARMTGTTWQWKEDGYTYEDIRNNPVIEDVLAEQFTRLGETVMPRRKELGIGCTDVGNLTHAFPALQSYVQVVPLLRGHTKEFEDACKSPDGHRAALTGAKALAMTAVELLSDDSLMEQVDRAFQDMKKQYE
jgi:metal-dependent amidase/aminoacylase/carboxypeptidase family protein